MTAIRPLTAMMPFNILVMTVLTASVLPPVSGQPAAWRTLMGALVPQTSLAA